MKILKIEFRNINSLKGEHVIDFTRAPFTTSSLFAITGPTGSGKTTILDVISLALFNQIPRIPGNKNISKADIEKTGAILTRNQKEAMAAVTYQGKNGQYRSEWSITTARTGNLRDYEMQISKIETQELIPLKKSEVPGKNEEFIGLSYNQFIKAVLLAQGEFAQFLKAKKEERGELLEKITGTGIYRQLGIKAYHKYKEVSSEIEAQQNRIAAIQEQLLTTEKEVELKEELRQKEADVKTLEKRKETLKKNLRLKEEINLQNREIQKRSIEKDTAKKNLLNFEAQHGLPLKQHEKIEDAAEDLRQWSLINNELKSLEEELKIFSKKKEKNSENKLICLQSVKAFTKADIEEETLEESLDSFQRKISWLQQQRQEKGKEYTSLKTHFLREVRELQFLWNEKNLEESRENLRELQGASRKKLSHLKNKLANLDLNSILEEKRQIAAQLDLAREAWRKEEEIINISTGLQRLQKEEEKLLPQIKSLPHEIETAKGKTALFNERLEKLHLKKQHELLQAKFEEQRHILIDGEPCPLCGSLRHPYAENLPEKDDSLQKEINITTEALKTWTAKLNTAAAHLKNYEQRLFEIKEEQKITGESLVSTEKIFKDTYGHLKPQKELSWENLCNKFQEALTATENWEKEQNNLRAINAGIPLLENLQKVMKEGTEIKLELDQLYTGKDINTDSGKLKKQWTELQQERKYILEQIDQIKDKESSKKSILIELEIALLPQIREKGFENIAAARGALMTESECRSLRSEREKFQKQINDSSASLKLLQSQLEKLKEADNEEAEDSLNHKLKEISEDLENKTKMCREVFSLIKNQEDNQERLQKIKAEITEKEKQISRWRLLNELIGDATGKKFNDFAQDLSLSQLLHLANIRLKDLSDRYRIDKPEKEEDDGLVAIDEHMGGQRRSVKTLSGGETFILSLSMALALSDLASKNVEINSLFIDEGFGTLDPETLDQTLDTLEKLQTESSKTIGIISHVDSLKERIATQIKLKRNGQGYSSLEVQG